jgi:uncharacterized protein YjbJ (UPF0337 family)
MGEFTDKIKGSINEAAGKMKQNSSKERVREEGAAQELSGKGDHSRQGEGRHQQALTRSSGAACKAAPDI